MRSNLFRAAALTAAALLFSTAPSLMAGPVLGANWIVNGGAESGTGSPTGDFVTVPGWSTYGAFPLITAVQYQATPGSFPASSEGPPSHGVNFFAGGPSSATSVGMQTIDVSAFATQIDSGLLTFVLSGYLGGWTTQDDYANLVVYFIGAPSGPIVQIDGPNSAVRGSQTGFLLESTTGVIPTGTRSIEFRLIMTRMAGSYNDGYADNLSFVATAAGAPVPEPGTAALLGAGGAALTGFGLWRRRRSQSR